MPSPPAGRLRPPRPEPETALPAPAPRPGLAREGVPVPAAEVPEGLTAQGDHQVAQQQQEAAAAPPRHVRGDPGGGSRTLRVPAGGRSAGGRAGTPELLRPERRSGSRSGGRGGGGGEEGGEGGRGQRRSNVSFSPPGALCAGGVWQVFPSPGIIGGRGAGEKGGLGLPLLRGSRWVRRGGPWKPEEGWVLRREPGEASSGRDAAKGRPPPRAAGIDRLCVWSRAGCQLPGGGEPGGGKPGAGGAGRGRGWGAGGARRPCSGSSLALLVAKLFRFAA